MLNKVFESDGNFCMMETNHHLSMCGDGWEVNLFCDFDPDSYYDLKSFVDSLSIGSDFSREVFSELDVLYHSL